MAKENINIDTFFHDAFEHLADIEPANAWEAVAGKLQQRKRRIQTFYTVAAACCVLCISLVAIFRLKDHTDAELVALPEKTRNETGRLMQAWPSLVVSGKPEAKTQKAVMSASESIETEAAKKTPFIVRQEVTAGAAFLADTTANKVSAIANYGRNPVRQKDVKDGVGQTWDYIASPANNGHVAVNKKIFAGFKLGYQTASSAYGISSAVLSPFIQYELNSKLAVSVQPAFAYNRISNTLLDQSVYYANVGPNAVTTSEGISPEGNAVYNHEINVQHDSLDIAFYTSGHYWQMELPLNLNYRIKKNIRVFAGIALRYTSGIAVKEIKNSYHIDRNIEIENATSTIPEAEVQNILDGQHSGTKYESGIADNYFKSNVPAFSPAYNIGFNYRITKKFDVEVQGNKSLSRFSNIPDLGIRSIHRQLSVRISLGLTF